MKTKKLDAERVKKTVVDYYLQAFDKLNNENKDTWNWSAGLFGPVWMLYRKMYLYAIVFSLLSLLITSITYKTFGDVGVSFLSITYLFEILLFGYYGNRLYLHIVNNKIKKGYHLLKNYHPYSVSIVCMYTLLNGAIIGNLGNGFTDKEGELLLCIAVIMFAIICSFADWIANGKASATVKYDASSHRQYLTYSQRNHRPGIIASVLCIIICGFLCTIPSGQDRINKEERLLKTTEETKSLPITENNGKQKGKETNNSKK